MDKIDAHHHLWQYSEEEYRWIPKDVIRKDFLLPELNETVKPHGVVGTVVVQVRQTERETKPGSSSKDT